MQDFKWIKELWEGKKFLGPVVERATAVPSLHALFDVAGGRVIVTSIVGEITTAPVAATVIRLVSTPTTGTPRNICEDVDIDAFAIGDLVGITGIPGDDLIPAAGVSSGTIPAQTVGVVVPIGAIGMVVGAVSAVTRIRWTLHYIKLDAGATVTPHPIP